MFVDWNGNGRLDCTDIGIGIALQAPDDAGIDIGGYYFAFVQELEPQRTLSGKMKLFYPQEKYSKKNEKPLNKYGSGPFCRFSIKSGYCRCKGVYALFDDDHLLYIGQTVNLEQRYNQGYGHIQPINCYAGGQSTNCKINAMILKKYQSGKHVFLYFYETNDFDAVEHELIEQFSPEYNSQTARHNGPKVKSSETEINNFDKVWNKIVSMQGEPFFTVSGVRFTYKIVGEDVYPLHIASGHATRSGFEKAYNLGKLESPSQLKKAGIVASSYVYAILTDQRITNTC